MKNKCAFLIGFFLHLGFVAFSQTSHWVSNNPNDLEVVDFTSFSAAFAAASSGDTLFLYSSEVSYGSPIIDKKIHIRGIGYNADTLSQPDLGIETFQYNPQFSELTLSSGAEGSSVQGVVASIEIDGTGDILIRRNYLSKLKCENSNNIQILDNYIGSDYYPGPFCAANYALRFNMVITNTAGIIIKNNLFAMAHTSSQCNTNRQNLFLANDCSGILVKNNLFRDDLLIDNAIIKNNIFTNWATNSGYGPNANNTISHNTFCQISNIPPGNTTGVDCNALFLGGTSFDGQWQLAPGSPAIGQGENGVDCGPFAGNDPYKLSGIYARPLIYEFHVPDEVPVGNNINVNIKVRAEN